MTRALILLLLALLAGCSAAPPVPPPSAPPPANRPDCVEPGDKTPTDGGLGGTGIKPEDCKTVQKQP